MNEILQRIWLPLIMSKAEIRSCRAEGANAKECRLVSKLQELIECLLKMNHPFPPTG